MHHIAAIGAALVLGTTSSPVIPTPHHAHGGQWAPVLTRRIMPGYTGVQTCPTGSITTDTHAMLAVRVAGPHPHDHLADINFIYDADGPDGNSIASNPDPLDQYHPAVYVYPDLPAGAKNRTIDVSVNGPVGTTIIVYQWQAPGRHVSLLHCSS